MDTIQCPIPVPDWKLCRRLTADLFHEALGIKEKDDAGSVGRKLARTVANLDRYARALEEKGYCDPAAKIDETVSLMLEKDVRDARIAAQIHEAHTQLDSLLWNFIPEGPSN